MEIKLINENWEEDFAKAGENNFKALGFKPITYFENVISHWKEIILRNNGISEKSFKIQDEFNKEFKNHINESVKTIVNEFENKNYRLEYCAEKLYNEFPLQEKEIFENIVKKCIK